MYLVVVEVGRLILHHLIHILAQIQLILLTFILLLLLSQRVGSIESVSGSYLTGLDSGIVSGAGQIGGLGYINYLKFHHR